MAEEAAQPAPSVDVHMADAGEHDEALIPETESAPLPLASVASTSSLPAVSSSTTAVDSITAEPPYSNNALNNDDVQPPPAKRARMHTDPDQASLANVRFFSPVRRCQGVLIQYVFVVSLKTATPPPASPSPPPSEPSPPATKAPERTGPPTFSVAQYRFCMSTVRNLKKMKSAGPFLYPVDPVALNIPHYPSVVKHPMDFATIERKLQSSNPAKPDQNAANPRYYHADEFVADVHLIFNNCILFNGPEHPISTGGKQIEEVFDKQIKNLPPPEEVRDTVWSAQPPAHRPLD